ncbi:MAG: HK97 family phage prohead protease [Selenomonadaceae bacterium]|nr:HK97 family phage prohead protease [Selenomonadaceae bacterium]
MQTEKRSYGLKEFRAVDSDGEKIIEGHAAVFEQRTDIGGCFFEVIDRGAFEDENSLRDVALFVNHNSEQIPLARSRRNNGNSTMTLKVDDVGLAIRAKLDVENNLDAKALWSAVKRGDIQGMSFAFRVGDEEWQNIDSEMPTRRIKKISRVFEVSAVAFPAYEQTDISARAAADTLESAKRALENARGKSSEDDKAQIEIFRLKNLILGGMHNE